MPIKTTDKTREHSQVHHFCMIREWLPAADFGGKSFFFFWRGVYARTGYSGSCWRDNNCEHRIYSISIAITTTNETSATTVIATNVLVLVIPPSSRPGASLAGRQSQLGNGTKQWSSQAVCGDIDLVWLGGCWLLVSGCLAKGLFFFVLDGLYFMVSFLSSVASDWRHVVYCLWFMVRCVVYDVWFPIYSVYSLLSNVGCQSFTDECCNFISLCLLSILQGTKGQHSGAKPWTKEAQWPGEGCFSREAHEWSCHERPKEEGRLSSVSGQRVWQPVQHQTPRCTWNMHLTWWYCAQPCSVPRQICPPEICVHKGTGRKTSWVQVCPSQPVWSHGLSAWTVRTD